VSYTITVNNTSGPSDAQNVVMSDALPAGTAFVSLALPAGWTRTDSTAVGANGTITATIPTLAAGAPAQVFTLVLSTLPNASTNLANTATVTSTTPDPQAANNASTDTDTPTPCPIPTFTSMPVATPSPALQGQPVTFTANATDSDGRNMTYVWDFGDGTTGTGPAPTHTYAQPGSYIVTVTATNDCGQSIGGTVTLTVLPQTCDITRPAIKNPPTITITWVQNGLDFTFTGTATDPEDGVLTNVSWNFGDGSSALGVNVPHNYAAPGAFFVTAMVTDKDGNCREAVVVVNPVVGTGSAGSGSLPGLSCTLLRISANFAKVNDDTLTMITQIVLPAGFSYANQPVTIQVAGLRVDGTVNAKGTFQDATHFIQLKELGGYTLVELKIKKSNIKAPLAIAANASIGQTLNGVGVLASVGNYTFIGNVDLVFSAVINGKATLKK